MTINWQYIAMTTARDDAIGLLDYAWQRFRGRMSGLDDREWAWTPATDDRISIRWRIEHLTDLLDQDRNHRWLGVAAEPRSAPDAPVSDAASALAGVEAAYATWRRVLDRTDDEGLRAAMGRVAGQFSASSGYSFVLHIADELIHHAAEAALLRDLYAETGSSR